MNSPCPYHQWQHQQQHWNGYGWNQRQLKCMEQEIYFLLARAILLGMHVCFQTEPHATCTQATKHNIIWQSLILSLFKDESNFRNIVSSNIKSIEVGLFMFVEQQKITLKCHNNVTAEEMCNFDGRHSFYKPNNFLLPFYRSPNGCCSMIREREREREGRWATLADGPLSSFSRYLIISE